MALPFIVALMAQPAEAEADQGAALQRLSDAVARWGIRPEDLREPYRSMLSTPPGENTH